MPADPAFPTTLDPNLRLHERVADLERQVRTLTTALQGGATQQIPVVDTLPDPGREGRVLMLSSDHKVYADNGTTWDAQT